VVADKDGVEATVAIRADSPNRAAPILALKLGSASWKAGT